MMDAAAELGRIVGTKNVIRSKAELEPFFKGQIVLCGRLADRSCEAVERQADIRHNEILQ